MLVLLASGAPKLASATVVVELTRDQLVERAGLIVRAKVVGQAFRWSEDHKQMLTLSELAVSSYLKGAGPETLTLRQFGGEMGELRSKVIGDAHLVVGQEVVLFLKPGAGVVYLSALGQSAFLIEKSSAGVPMVSQPALEELSFYNPGDKSLTRLAPRPTETLEQLITSVKARIGGGR